MTTTTINTELTPAIVEIPAGRSIILTVDGKPVVFLRAKEVSTRTSTVAREEYENYEYCGMGITIMNEMGWSDKFVSGCATTMALEVQHQTVESVTEAYSKRYQVMWK